MAEATVPTRGETDGIIIALTAITAAVLAIALWGVWLLTVSSASVGALVTDNRRQR